MKNKFPYTCSYEEAIKSLGIQYILCNYVEDVDKESLHKNLKTGKEVIQWYLTDAFADTIRFAEKHFDSVFFTYSEKLDLYVLASTVYGMSWEDVIVNTDLEYFKPKQ